MTVHRPIVQIAYIVPEVRTAAQQWADRVGAGPFFVFDHFELTATHRGESWITRPPSGSGGMCRSS
jgi:hypothetical protein